MTHKVAMSVRATRQVRRIHDYIADHASPAIAEGFIKELLDYCYGFDLFPVRGVARDDIRPGARMVGFKRKASIAFTVDADTVTVIAVFYRGENPDEILKISEP